jgi:hypothetical protein
VQDSESKVNAQDSERELSGVDSEDLGFSRQAVAKQRRSAAPVVLKDPPKYDMANGGGRRMLRREGC